MKYRILEAYNKTGYTPEYFTEGQGWKVAYTEQYDKMTYATIEEAKLACQEHALKQRKVVWSDEL